MRYFMQGAVITTAVVALAACGGSREASTDLSADLERAGAATPSRMDVVSALEQRPTHRADRAPAARRTIAHHAAVAKQPSATVALVTEPTREAPVEAVVVSAPEPKPAPAPEAVTVAPEPAGLPAARPSPIPASTGRTGGGGGGGGGDCGWREMGCVGGGGGGISVVLRGGGVDGDHCDPRRGRGGLSIPVAINQRFPMGGRVRF